MTGIELIEAERQRQISSEGWNEAHDDQHWNGELCAASACYAKDVACTLGGLINYETAPDGWPWDAEWWKPTPEDPIRQLTKAGALIAAEIDRLQRAS